MSAQSLFSKKNIASQQPTDTHRGLLDELSLPPQMISFIRKNARSLQIGLIIVVVLVNTLYYETPTLISTWGDLLQGECLNFY